MQDAVPEDQMKEEMMESIQKGNFTMKILKDQLQNILKMGPVGQVMGMIPGFGNSMMPKVSACTLTFPSYPAPDQTSTTKTACWASWSMKREKAHKCLWQQRVLSKVCQGRAHKRWTELSNM